MKLHPIFSKTYLLWWFTMASIIALKIIIVGGGVTEIDGYENSGYFVQVFGILLCGIVYATPFYLLYRLFSKKWNNRIYMILISTFVGIVLLIF